MKALEYSLLYINTILNMLCCAYLANDKHLHLSIYVSFVYNTRAVMIFFCACKLFSFNTNLLSPSDSYTLDCFSLNLFITFEHRYMVFPFLTTKEKCPTRAYFGLNLKYN